MALLRRSRKKVVKPTAKEQKIITSRLQRKYPQMYKPIGMSAREVATYNKLSPADKRALGKMVGLELKKKYRSK